MAHSQTITTQRHIRALFWAEYPTLNRRKVGGYYVTDTRVAFCDFIERLHRDGSISSALANRVTL
jgi:hypothetical protein